MSKGLSEKETVHFVHKQIKFSAMKKLPIQGVSKVVIPIENCILYTAFDASIGKFKLIQLRNLSRKQFKAISN